MFHRTWHAHKLQLLNACYQRQNVSAASARLPATILATRITLCRQEFSCLWRTCLVALDAQIFGFHDTTLNRTDVAGGFTLMAVLAKHIALGRVFKIKK